MRAAGERPPEKTKKMGKRMKNLGKRVTVSPEPWLSELSELSELSDHCRTTVGHPAVGLSDYCRNHCRSTVGAVGL